MKDITEMSDDELRDEKLRLVSESDRLKIQIKQTAGEGRRYGAYVDPKEWAKLHGHSQLVKLRMVAIQHEQQRRGEERKQARVEQRALGEYFIDTAKRLLPREQFQRLLQIAIDTRANDDKPEGA